MTEPIRWIVTANFTDDGAVAWRRGDGSWSRTFAEVGLVDTEADAKAQVAAAAQREQREVSDPYIVEVTTPGGILEPPTARERIRAQGPTIRIRRPD